MRPIIAVENLSKKYRISHLSHRPRYKSLRDVITEGITGSFRSRRSRKQGASPPRSEEFWALKGVNFEIRQGEVVGVIGQNGAGKSTLLKVLSRITDPTAGRIRLRGRVASLLEVGTGFHPELTGRENIFLNGAILGMSRAEIKAKFDEIVAFAGVEKFLDTPVKHYSSGMYVRLAFAVAAHLEPEILVIDEVLAVGDAEFQKKCLGKMEEVAKDLGRTILFVSHNMSAVRSLCSRAILLADGKLIADDSVDNVIESYLAAGAETELSWKRPANGSPSTPVYYQTIVASLRGRQPELKLIVDAEIVCEEENPAQTFVSIDLCDALGTPLMQAIPEGRPFLNLALGMNCIQITVDLPGLTPGRYLADLWIGTHYTRTLDYVKRVVAITVEESPMPNRTFPHSAGHGFMIAPSDCYVEARVPA
jgi:lipopolysaccharide transport system ATP-binding protein